MTTCGATRMHCPSLGNIRSTGARRYRCWLCLLLETFQVAVQEHPVCPLSPSLHSSAALLFSLSLSLSRILKEERNEKRLLPHVSQPFSFQNARACTTRLTDTLGYHTVCRELTPVPGQGDLTCFVLHHQSSRFYTSSRIFS